MNTVLSLSRSARGTNPSCDRRDFLLRSMDVLAGTAATAELVLTSAGTARAEQDQLSAAALFPDFRETKLQTSEAPMAKAARAKGGQRAAMPCPCKFQHHMN